MGINGNKKKVKCSFCSRDVEIKEGHEIIIGASGSICRVCYKEVLPLCFDNVEPKKEQYGHVSKLNEEENVDQEKTVYNERTPIDIVGSYTPKDIKKILDERVIGQEIAKKVISVAIHNHYKRLNHEKVNLLKSNILLVGPTGSGKSHIAKMIANILDVPFAKYDATGITKAGYVGNDVEGVLYRLYVNAEYDVEYAQQGIVFIDEIDKVAKRSDGEGKDINGEGVQQDLLTLIDGTVISIPPGGSHKPGAMSQGRPIDIDTSGILFIFGGAFSGLEDIIKKRTQQKRSIGFGQSGDVLDAEITFEGVKTDDLVQYGFLPEFLGRIPIIAPLNKLDKNALIDILSNTKDSIVDQYTSLFEASGIELDITHEALDEIAHQAMLKETGARGLKSILEATLLEPMYELPGSDIKKFEVGREHVTLG